MRRRASIGLGAAIFLASAPASAVFHFWDVSEVFSNADGSVQYIEFFTTLAFQEQVGAHVIRTEQANVVLESFLIPQNLPLAQGESTADRFFLVATPDFEASAGIAPDYVLPSAGFIEVGVADEVGLVEADFIALGGLPTDGVNALYDGGGVAAASPTNFAGDLGTIVPEPAQGALVLAAAGTLLSLARVRRGGATSTRRAPAPRAPRR